MLQTNAVNQLTKDTVIFKEEENVTHICMILKGRIAAQNQGSKVILTQGSIFGIQDLFIGRYLSDYVVIEDAVVYPFAVDQIQSLEKIMGLNKDYNGVMVASVCYQIRELSMVAEALRECTDTLYSFISESYRRYIDYAGQMNLSVSPLNKADLLKPYYTDFEMNLRAVDYYTACSKIPLSSVKDYFGNSTDIAMYQIEEAAGVAARLSLECIELTNYLQETFSILMNRGESCLFKITARMYQQISESGFSSEPMMTLIDAMVDEINRVDAVFNRYTGTKLAFDRKQFNEMYASVMSGNLSIQQETEMSQTDILDSLKDSLRQILHYATLEKNKEQQLIAAMEYFVQCTDRLTQEEQLRNCRKVITSTFFELYENVFLLSKEQSDIPKPVELFLNYGFLDERLLTNEQQLSIAKLSDVKEVSRLNVYSLYDWLTLVYEGKRPPSKNEFDLNYTEYLREQRKTNSITEEEERRLSEDGHAKLHFEIHNMFAYNDKIVNAQVSTFVPCLYKEMFMNWPEKEHLTARKLNDAFERVLSIDYSAFYREMLYMAPEVGIEKEYIMQEVYPEMILLPMVGSNASMWQETGDKRKNTPGRFVFPVFLDTNLDDLMIRLFGRFRWELCRNIQGTAWNNLKHKSLTSEYVDYLQFYRKNRDLSEDKKEKLKLQIQKGRNNSREVFVIDYEAWIKGEANGAIRLNKVAREFLATYCPFAKPIRERLKPQPMFSEAYARFDRETAKSLHELEGRVRARQKENIDVTKEIADTLVFYREM